MQLKLSRLFETTPRRLAFALMGAALTLAGPVAATAQNLFAPAITVNDEVITNFELNQRIRFLTILRAPGDPEELARKALIDDRLRDRALRDAEIVVTEEQIREGIAELAGRTQLSAVQFVEALKEEGVAPETLRDFVRINLGWREFVRQRFLEQARPSRDDVDRAIGRDLSGGGLRVLLSEIIIPVTPQTLTEVEDLAQQISEITSFATFESAARQYSASDSRQNGGKLDWIAINTLPPQLRPVILELNPGETSAPVPLSNAVAIFQMRGIEEIAGGTPSYSSIDYATYFIPGGRSPEALSQAETLRAQVDRCDDLYGIAKDQPETVLERKDVAPGAIPRDIALELAKLDEGEVSTALTRSNGQTLVFLMLCGRTAALNESGGREEVAAALTQQRITALADSYLDQLRADALIVER
jgi:peptidyl-prolyl cis-trans isomerase SurA